MSIIDYFICGFAFAALVAYCNEKPITNSAMFIFIFFWWACLLWIVYKVIYLFVYGDDRE